ncbi:MAG: hypothetical protein ACYTKD_02210 [Planctomycetota bacterium]|jgi:hypothetical protein
MRTIEVFLALAIAMLAGCARTDAPSAAAPRTRAHERVHEGLVATAVVSEKPGDAERLLAPAFASAVGAADLGAATSELAARTAARAAGADLVLVCRVSEYDPYDPQRLVLKLALVDVAAGRLGAADVMAFGWTPAHPPGGRERETVLWAARAEIDAGSDEMLRAFALERGLVGGRMDLVEASILVRDPERFFPFAARRVASRAPVRASQAPKAGALAARR